MDDTLVLGREIILSGRAFFAAKLLVADSVGVKKDAYLSAAGS